MPTWIIPIALLLLFEGVADVFSKHYSLSGHPLPWIGAIAGYIIGNIFWLSAIRSGSGLARGSIIFSVGSAIVAVVLGLLLYKEKTSSLEIVGIILGVIAIAIIVSAESTS